MLISVFCSKYNIMSLNCSETKYEKQLLNIIRCIAYDDNTYLQNAIIKKCVYYQFKQKSIDWGLSDKLADITHTCACIPAKNDRLELLFSPESYIA